MLCEARPLHVRIFIDGRSPGLDAVCPSTRRCPTSSRGWRPTAPSSSRRRRAPERPPACRAPCSRRGWRSPARSGSSSRGGCRRAWRPRAWPRSCGERVGETVGYTVRFDEAGGPRTRLRFVTEGLFMRRLLADPSSAASRRRRARRAARAARGDRSGARLAAPTARRGAPDLRVWRCRRRSRPSRCARSWPVTGGGRPPCAARGAGSTSRSSTCRWRRRATTARSSGGSRAPSGASARGARRRPAGLSSGRRRDPARAGGARRAARRRAELAILPLHGEMPLEEQTRAVRPDRRGAR